MKTTFCHATDFVLSRDCEHDIFQMVPWKIHVIAFTRKYWRRCRHVDYFFLPSSPCIIALHLILFDITYRAQYNLCFFLQNATYKIDRNCQVFRFPPICDLRENWNIANIARSLILPDLQYINNISASFYYFSNNPSPHLGLVRWIIATCSQNV